MPWSLHSPSRRCCSSTIRRVRLLAQRRHTDDSQPSSHTNRPCVFLHAATTRDGQHSWPISNARTSHRCLLHLPRHISCLGSIRVKQSMCEVGFLPPDEQQATFAGMCVAWTPQGFSKSEGLVIVSASASASTFTSIRIHIRTSSGSCGSCGSDTHEASAGATGMGT